jgi:c-di-GMP-related signal transduction protein
MNAYVARQPIFNRRKKIFGYELLFRDATAQPMSGLDGDLATTTVLDNTFLNIGTDALVGNKKSFINFTQNLLLQKVPLLLPKEEIVVEILESVKPTPELIAACQEIARNGYTFALDDFIYNPDWEPLMALADIIKIDFRVSSLSDIQTTLDAIGRRDGMSLLAEKVETYAEFKIAVEMGFDLFQGYFFCKPEVIKSRDISASELNLLRIIAAVNQADFDFKTLEKIIAPDVSLSYKLLRYINSAFFAKAQTINSIQQALIYMGESEIRRFVSLIGMSNLSKGKPEELIKASCIRAKVCESLASVATTPVPPAELFTLGMFSLIDAILDQDMQQVMRALPLTTNINNALVHRTGVLIGYLALVEYYERGQWALFDRLAAALKIPKNAVPTLYCQACKWADAFTEPE